MSRSPIGNNITHVKNHNRQAILQTLLQTPMSRVELAGKLELSTMTATNLVRELTESGFVTAAPAPQKSVGRPRTTLTINADAGHAIGVQMGIGYYWITLVNLHGKTIHRQEGQFNLDTPPTAVLRQIAQEITALTTSPITTQRPIFGIGFGASGLVDSRNGINIYAPSLGWRQVPIQQILQEETDLPVVVENNVRAMALAEAYFGAGQTADSLAFVFGRTGIGAGLVLNGRLYRGHHMGAGEIGHTRIIPDGGQACHCGQSGCLETLVTQSALLAYINALPNALLDTSQSEAEQYSQLLTLGRAGHPEILAAVQRVGRYLGLALINLINTLNPEIIFIGGMYAQGADLFLPTLRQTVNQQAFGQLGQQTKIEPTSFGLAAGTIGAACTALVHFFYQQHNRQIA